MNEQARANRDATVKQIMRNELESPAAHRDGNSSLNYQEKVCKCPIKQCRGKVPPQCTKMLCHSCCKALTVALKVVEHGVPEGGALVPCSLRCLFTGTPRRPGHEVTAEAWSNHFGRHWVSHLRTNPEELEKWKANRLDSNRSDSPPRSRQRTSIGHGVASAAQPQVQLQLQDRPEQQPQPQPRPQPPAQPQPQLYESNVHRQPEPQAPTSVQPKPITEHQAQPQAQAQPQLPTDQLRPPQQPRPQSQPQVELQLTSAPPLLLAPQPTPLPTSSEMPRQPVATPEDVDVLTRDDSILDLDLTHPIDEAVCLAQLATLSTVPPNGVFDQPPPDNTNAEPPRTQTSVVSTPNVINVGLSAEVRSQRERPNILECAVCFDVFDEHDIKPMILPCGQGDTICAACDALIEPEQ